jgi:hypothetical protein
MFELTPLSIGLMIGVFVVCTFIFVTFVRRELK